MQDDELESAKNFPDRGELTILHSEVTAEQKRNQRGWNEAQRVVLRDKGLPMCGTTWPAFHPDFRITCVSQGDSQKFTWVRRSLLTDGCRACGGPV